MSQVASGSESRREWDQEGRPLLLVQFLDEARAHLFDGGGNSNKRYPYRRPDLSTWRP